MSTELQLFDGSMLTGEERADLEKQIESVIEAHKDNRQEVNRLVFESAAIMAEAEDYEDELSSRRGFRRFWGAITGSNKRLQEKINASRGAAQYAAQQTINKLAEQNVMTFDLLVAVNNKLNASMVGVGNELNRIYTGLLSFFKQYQSDLVRIANTMERLEQNVNLLNWQNSIEYQMLDGTEYVELDDAAKIVCLARDFYDITGGEWHTSDLLLLKTAMNTIALPPNSTIPYGQFIREISGSSVLSDYLLAGRKLAATPPPFSTTLLGIRKTQLLDGEENYIVAGNAELLLENDVKADEGAIKDRLVSKYMLQEAGIDIASEVKHFDLLLGVLNELALVQSGEVTDFLISGDADLSDALQEDDPEGQAVSAERLDPDSALRLIYRGLDLGSDLSKSGPDFSVGGWGKEYAISIEALKIDTENEINATEDQADTIASVVSQLAAGGVLNENRRSDYDAASNALQEIRALLQAAAKIAKYGWNKARQRFYSGTNRNRAAQQAIITGSDLIWRLIHDKRDTILQLFQNLETEQLALKYPDNTEEERRVLAKVNFARGE